jgi:hypothetical protein
MRTQIKELISGLYGNEYNAGIIARELFQNAIDATYLRYKKEKNFEGRITAWITQYGYLVMDNGTGMDKDELEKAYGAIGYSSKGDLNSAGFFGIGGKSMGTSWRAEIISFSDKNKDGYKLTLSKNNEDLVYEIQPFKNNRKFRGTIIFFKNSGIQFPLPDPTIYLSGIFDIEIKYAYQYFLQQFVFQSYYYAFYAYVMGIPIEIWVNGRLISPPKKIIENFFGVIKKKEGLALIYPIFELTKLEEEDNIFDDIIINISGISYLKEFNYELNESDKRHVLSIRNKISKSDSLFAKYILIDNMVTLTPDRNADDVSQQIVNDKNVIALFNGMVSELNELYLKINNLKAENVKGENDECVLKGNYIKDYGKVYMIPSVYLGGEFPLMSRELFIKKILQGDRIYTHDINYKYSVLPVPNAVKYGCSYDLVRSVDIFSPDDFIHNIYTNISRNYHKINGCIFIKDPDNLDSKKVIYLEKPFNERRQYIKGFVKSLIDGLPEYVPPPPAPQPEFLPPAIGIELKQSSLDSFGIDIEQAGTQPSAQVAQAVRKPSRPGSQRHGRQSGSGLVQATLPL